MSPVDLVDAGAAKIMRNAIHSALPRPEAYVPESRFGTWFIHTGVWSKYVIEKALDDLEPLIIDRRAAYPVIADVGCGWGLAFKFLRSRFHPRRLIAVDINSQMIAAAREEARRNQIDVEFYSASASLLPIPDGSLDLLFCHQTFHHIVDQQKALAEFYRVLKPGGLLLFAESTREFIHSWIIRLLFRHPMEVQRGADEYLSMIRHAGFTVAADAIAYPDLWWSLPPSTLIRGRLGLAPPANPQRLLSLAALRP